MDWAIKFTAEIRVESKGLKLTVLVGNINHPVDHNRALSVDDGLSRTLEQF